jgi:5-methylcytosine-specific restriction enzyme subunit McrC
MNPPVQCFEYSKLLIDQEGFKRQHWDALAIYNEKHSGRFFDLLHNGVKFKQYVGVIQVGNLTIEILPKIDRKGADKADWQGVLLDMLKECRWMQVFAHEKASLRLKHNSILDAYLEIFLDACERLLHEGLVKKYRKNAKNLKVWKGKMNFTQNIRQNLVHEERFFTEHSVYDRDNIFNQILLKALKIIPNFTVSPVIRDKLSRLLLDFPELKDINVEASTFQNLVFDRKTERYKEPIEIAAMLLLNYRPDIRGGRNHVLAILFDMNQLWEEYFYRRLRVALPPNWSIQRQPRKVFWELKEAGQKKIIKPDIVLTNPEKANIIIDTKWKTPEGFVPSDNDLKQVFVYNKYWSSKYGILIYPLNEVHFLSPAIGKYLSEPDIYCIVVKVNILTIESGRLNQNFTIQVIEYIQSDTFPEYARLEPLSL